MRPLDTIEELDRERPGRGFSCGSYNKGAAPMQDRYVGDVGDYGKYGLLRSLCGGDELGKALRLGVLCTGSMGLKR